MSDHCCGSNKSEEAIPSNKVTSEAVSEFKVVGMDCADEVSAIRHALQLREVARVDANLMKGTVTVYHAQSLGAESIKLLIEKAGVKVVKEAGESFFRGHLWRIIEILISGVALTLGLLFDWLALGSDRIAISFFCTSIIAAGLIIFPKAWRSIRSVKFDMNVLMTIAAIGAIVLGEFSEAASVVFLFSMAELLEALSVDRARKAIRDVLNVTPKEATLIENGNDSRLVPVDSLKFGDVILVRPGEYVPVDGTVIEGESSLNQASLTGESVFVSKTKGDTVWGGTVNETGVLRVSVEKAYKDTKIAKVIALVEEAQSVRAPTQRFVDRFASIYTPTVLALALLVACVPPIFLDGIWTEWVYKALVLLVIGCPCALVIATPISVVSGLTSLARRGVLVKGGAHLESLGKITALALDKTGTITAGKPHVSEMRNFSNHSDDEILKLAASLESLSTHPLALAVLEHAQKKSIKFSHPSDFKMIPGKGAEGLIEGQWYFVGSHLMAHEIGICTPEVESYLAEIEGKAMSIIILGVRPGHDRVGEVLAIMAVGDELRAGVREAVKKLHDVGIKTVVMLSGDNQKTVDAVSKQVGIDYARGALLPEQKVSEIKSLVERYRYVGMVGDGVNDAPALAHATIGIAMGAAGSDTAIETADVALMKDDLSELPKAIAHGRRVLGVIQFNIVFSLAIKALFFVFTFLGVTNLWMAVGADMGASLLVSANALRLLRVKDN